MIDLWMNLDFPLTTAIVGGLTGIDEKPHYISRITPTEGGLGHAPRCPSTTFPLTTHWSQHSATY